MSDAIRIEQRLHHLEQRLGQIVSGWGRRNGGSRSGEGSPREMERQAVDRLFKEPHRAQAPARDYDANGAREVEREAMSRLYGDRSTIVVEVRGEDDKTL